MPVTMSLRQKVLCFIEEEQMNKRFSKILSLMLAAVVAFGMIGVGTFNTYAAGKWKLDCSSRWAGGECYFYVYDSSTDDWTEATITSIKSSNKKVISVKKNTYDGEVYFTTKCKKAGKSKITVKYKTPAGKTGKITKTFRVKKYPNEIKSLVINGDKVNISKNKFEYQDFSKKTSVSIKAALKSGWKIRDIYSVYYDKNWKDKKVKVTKKMIKNGTKISFPKKYIGLDVTLYLEKGDDEITYDVFFGRP